MKSVGEKHDQRKQKRWGQERICGSPPGANVEFCGELNLFGRIPTRDLNFGVS